MVRVQLVLRNSRIVREIVDILITAKSAKKKEFLGMVLEEDPREVEMVLNYYLENEEALR